MGVRANSNTHANNMTCTCIEKQNQITSVDKPRSRATTKNYSTHIAGNTKKTRIDTSPQKNINLTHHTKACIKPSTQLEQQKASCKITTQYFRSEFLRTCSETRKPDQDNARYKTSTHYRNLADQCLDSSPSELPFRDMQTHSSWKKSHTPTTLPRLLPPTPTGFLADASFTKRKRNLVI